MSDPRIALVAEGSTDFIVIEAALKAILQRPFVLNQLQPEPTRPEMGGGWCGVFKWCQGFRKRGAAHIESDPTLSNFDLVMVHLDADVADKSYADCGDAVVQAALALQPLPCAQPCPPPSDTVLALEAVLRSWLGISATGSKSLFCIPSKATEAWLAAATLPANHALLTGLECNLHLETQLAQLPRGQRIRKSVRQYRKLAGVVTAQWTQVISHCSQAALFDQRVQSIAQAFLP
ncbi:hypothetical protein A6M27_11505 [Acidithiobacillus thiooxidans]|jgi:hypothetical protein|uniref:ATP-dependent endonuclease n=1 Tax=Acidithiobacillus thiooxidans TaxID=930 RepID=A0A1C2JF85_ACITH|nr:hypothetical protein [Acidithiobacillus thiooxidans]OCX67887.1 hypothetical protein A6O24_20415 [Acidithiobacillus thiooxidans]OCX72854.1 hypothetical protein A6P07_09270 [Acidithiobacillus thiooxidans]OCX83852.1 hypothetical protein A6O26_06125 [Acidithiobacillus thiooxidans]OCX86855.1 hypothetical protein A6M27_11505 [Acidithiobacillus thiooxidans]OFC48890.1 hypothetical protein BAE47_06525 [Acidithiobacillus thiooxidans]